MFVYGVGGQCANVQGQGGAVEFFLKYCVESHTVQYRSTVRF